MQPKPLSEETSVLTLRRIEAGQSPVLLISRASFSWAGFRLFDGQDFGNDDMVSAPVGPLLARDPSIRACAEMAPGTIRSRAAAGAEWVVGWHPDGTYVRKLVGRLDTKKSLEQSATWVQLSFLGGAVVPLLVDAYDTAKLGEGRTAILFYLISYGRTNPEVRALAERALADRSRMARRRACEVLAYGLDPASIPALEAASRASQDDETRQNISLAIKAIRTQNHNAMHPGVNWIVRPEDEVGAKVL